MIKAVVFDMDGVLIDAKEWHYDALNQALRLFGLEISRADHLTTFDGLPTRRKLEMLTVTEGLPQELHGFINALKQAYTMEIVNARCRPTFVHEYALAKLKARGLKLAVASNSVRNSVTAMMERSRLDRYLDVQLSNEDVSRAKPDPEIYVQAMERLGVRPEETLIVEDNEHGIRAARASGAHVLVVRTVDDVNLANIDRRIAEIAA
ncbi:HAD family hydrolase [Brevundimonas sp. VNH65]|uniref:HAD family hydrolase n=1 Tax=Brevundimonas sp. VNH65 TaxID=3400917 RepID=UPI003C06AEEE